MNLVRGVVDECFHCGLPVPQNTPWRVTIDNMPRAMCCLGCQAVAQGIVDNGLADYYSTRIGFSATAAQQVVPPELRLYDVPRNLSESGVGSGVCETTFCVEGIRCAACVWLIEHRLARLAGVHSAALNAATERLLVRWDTQQCKPSDILASIREIGYAAYPFDATRQGAHLECVKKTLFRRLFVAGLAMMQVMMYAFPGYVASEGAIDADIASLMRWASLVLTLPALVYSAQPFFKGAWIDLKNRVLGMDVPVVLGISAAFIGSVVATWRGQGEVYFDSITMFVFFLLCSRYLELTARRKAAQALDHLHHALPASALRMSGYPESRDTELILADNLCEGDIVLVKPGQAIAADGILVEGETTVDASLLTGEAEPQRKVAGASLPGGAVNVSQPIVVRITRLACDSTLSVLTQLVERAGQGKPRLSLWADKVAAWFVAALLLLAMSVFVWWQYHDLARAWPIAMAVLVVSCPCALSLATPTALAAAMGTLLRQGILVVQPHVLEAMHHVTHIVFDKTGTLTEGRPLLRHIEVLGRASATDCLSLAAALEASSAHPLGTGIVAAAQDQGVQGDATLVDIQHFAGQGLQASVAGVLYRLGCAQFVQALSECALEPSAHEVQGMTSIYLGSQAGWLARFDLADGLRSDARCVVALFQRSGKAVILLSGDRQPVAQHMANSLGIDSAFGDMLPEQKVAFVRKLQSDGAVVAMVGDGINDAAVLRTANVSFAMGGGAALAQTRADCVLLSGRLSSLCDIAHTAARTLSIIKQNLAWAMLYNALAIPAAALGLLNPWLSAVGMSLSSVVVVANASRLRLNNSSALPLAATLKGKL